MGNNQPFAQLQEASDKHAYNINEFIKYMNWTLFLKDSVGGENICAFGDDGALLELHYRNKLATGKFTGLNNDSALTASLNKEWEKVAFATFKTVDLTMGGNDYSAFTNIEADKVISLNLPENISRTNFYYYLQNFYLSGNPNATYYIQLPNATDQISAADIKTFISTYFNVVKRFGISGTVGDFQPFLNDAQQKMVEGLRPYYNDEFIAGIFAPFFPDQCQQVLYVLKRKTATLF